MLAHWHDTPPESVHGDDWFITHLSHAHDIPVEDLVTSYPLIKIHDAEHAAPAWAAFMALPLIEVRVEENTVAGTGEHALADAIQRAVGPVEIEHFHLRDDCPVCMDLATLPVGHLTDAEIRQHIIGEHSTEILVNA